MFEKFRTLIYVQAVYNPAQLPVFDNLCVVFITKVNVIHSEVLNVIFSVINWFCVGFFIYTTCHYVELGFILPLICSGNLYITWTCTISTSLLAFKLELIIFYEAQALHLELSQCPRLKFQDCFLWKENENAHIRNIFWFIGDFTSIQKPNTLVFGSSLWPKLRPTISGSHKPGFEPTCNRERRPAVTNA